MNENINKLQKLRKEFFLYYNATSEYGIGYLDCLTEVCEAFDIPVTRTENDIIIGKTK